MKDNMISTKRYDETRVPTKLEAKIVRGRMSEWYKTDSGEYKHRNISFNQAWKQYMKDEQKELDMLLRRETKLIAEDVEKEVPSYTIEDVLQSVHNTHVNLNVTVFKAIRLYNMEVAKGVLNQEVFV